MNILLCSPYLQNPDIIPGGINMWAHNILSYRELIASDVDLIPVSLDRRNYISVGTNIFKRIYFGVKELSFSIKKAEKIMCSDKIDVIHICTSASLSLIKDIILLRSAKKKKKKSTLHLHFGRVPQLIEQNNWEWFLLKKALLLSTVVVTMDMHSYNALRNLGYDNVEYCPNPLSLEIINQIEKDKEDVKRIPNKFLFVGHVIPTKGVYELVEACKNFEDIELDIIGKVEETVEQELTMSAKKGNNSDWIHFLGEIPHSEVIKHLLSASIFVFPSYTEGFPNVILEAMACGIPIVATTVGAIPEMLDMQNGNDNGICIEPKNVEALTNGIQIFITDKEYAQKCALNAQKRVNELYAVPVVWNRLTDIWKKTYEYRKKN